MRVISVFVTSVFVIPVFVLFVIVISVFVISVFAIFVFMIFVFMIFVFIVIMAIIAMRFDLFHTGILAATRVFLRRHLSPFVTVSVLSVRPLTELAVTENAAEILYNAPHTGHDVVRVDRRRLLAAEGLDVAHRVVDVAGLVRHAQQVVRVDRLGCAVTVLVAVRLPVSAVLVHAVRQTPRRSAVRVAARAVHQHDQREAGHHGEELEQTGAVLLPLGRQDLEEDHVEDGASGERLQQTGGQQSRALVLVQLLHRQTDRHPQRRRH